MASFEETITIDAPVETVWATLADIGSISEWNPGVRDSRATGDSPTGLGATRRCDLPAGRYLDEEVVEFVDGEALTMRITDSNVPMDAQIRFTIAATGDATLVTVAPEYSMKYGPLGAVMDRLGGRRMYRKGMHDLLEGLKNHVEGAPTD
jgi:uncharacterized protein YndB with AHSA1/START domain